MTIKYETVKESEDIDKPILYTLKSCMYCNQMKRFLKKHNVDFEERDADNYSSEMIRIKAQGVPILVYKDYVVRGFDKEELIKLLDLEVKNV